MLNISTQFNLKNLDKFLKSTSKQALSSVLVGIPQNAPNRKIDTTKPLLTNAEIAYINEYGSPSQNIPARPFLIPTIQREKAKIVKILQPSNANDLLTNFEKVGLYASAQVKKTITDQIGFKPLSKKTLKARSYKRKDRSYGEKALIDTGQLRQSINYIVLK